MSRLRDAVASALVLTAPLVVRAIAHGIRRGEPAVSPAHLGVLLCVSRRALNLSQLASILAVSAPTASRSVDTLESRGWVRRVRNPEDRRAVAITVTDAGRDMLARLQRQAEQRAGEMLESLSEDECAQLLEALSLLRRLLPADQVMRAVENGD